MIFNLKKILKYIGIFILGLYSILFIWIFSMTKRDTIKEKLEVTIGTFIMGHQFLFMYILSQIS